MLRREGFEHGSESQNNRNENSILDMMEDVKDEHVGETPAVDYDLSKDREEEGVTEYVLKFKTQFEDLDINNREQMLKAENLMKEAYAEAPVAGKQILKWITEKVIAQREAAANQQVTELADQTLQELQGISMEDLDEGIEKGRSAHA